MNESICGYNCSTCDYNFFCGGCSMCEKVLCCKDCKNCLATCFEKNAVNNIQEVCGPLFSLKNNKIVELPFHIPIFPQKLPENLNFEEFNTSNSVVSVHGESFLLKKGNNVADRFRRVNFKEALNVSNVNGLLEFYSKDKCLEGLWLNRYTMYKHIKRQKFLAVIAPNFSVYEDYPRIDHLYNMKRSSIIYNELIDYGINAIPDISFYNKKDLDRYLNEIHKANIKMISVGFHIVGWNSKGFSIDYWLRDFQYMVENLPPDAKIIISGIISPIRLLNFVELMRKEQSLHILSSTAFLQARQGVISSVKQTSLETPKSEVLKKNITFYNDIYKELNKHLKNPESSLFHLISKWNIEEKEDLIKNKNNSQVAKLYNISEKQLIMAIYIASKI